MKLVTYLDEGHDRLALLSEDFYSTWRIFIPTFPRI
jgi:hypothetical protein